MEILTQHPSSVITTPVKANQILRTLVINLHHIRTCSKPQIQI